jgi:hypothetical protein
VREGGEGKGVGDDLDKNQGGIKSERGSEVSSMGDACVSKVPRKVDEADDFTFRIVRMMEGTFSRMKKYNRHEGGRGARRLGGVESGGLSPLAPASYRQWVACAAGGRELHFKVGLWVRKADCSRRAGGWGWGGKAGRRGSATCSPKGGGCGRVGAVRSGLSPLRPASHLRGGAQIQDEERYCDGVMGGEGEKQLS